MMKSPPRTVNEYLSKVGREQRAGLEKLRRTIRSAAPKAEECISYGIPAFRMNGKLLVAYGAAAKHLAFYPGAWPIAAHRAELKGFSTSKGTIRFQPEKPIPAALIRGLVRARIAQYSAK